MMRKQRAVQLTPPVAAPGGASGDGQSESPRRASTGIRGLDEVLHGGLLPERAYLLRGGPGTGKTSVGLHFLTAGAAQQEPVLFITLAEPESQIRKNAAAMGFDLTGVTFLDLCPTPEFFARAQSYDLFSPAEVEREPTTMKIVAAVESLRPRRVFLDAVTQLRYLVSDPFQFRREVFSLLGFLIQHGATVLFTSEASPMSPDDDLQFLADGVIHLEASPEGRNISVTKFRGSGFRKGRHSLRLSHRGVEVFPRLIPNGGQQDLRPGLIPAGVPALDELLNGGLERGTVTLITGPSGVGKTTLGVQFLTEAARHGERAVAYAFEEAVPMILARCDEIGIPARAMVERGTLALVPVEPLQYSPDEFASLVRVEVEERQASLVMIDSISGYRLSLRQEDLVLCLHSLSAYLKSRGVTLLLINEVEAVTGDFQATELGISYLADNIIFLRYLEMAGELRKAIGVLKKRLSDFEKTLRELEITPEGIQVGRPLSGLRGILEGSPEWVVLPEES